MKQHKVTQTLSGTLVCPTCQSAKICKIENVGLFITRYKCKKCNLTFRYDRTPTSIPIRQFNPYHSFTRGLKIVQKGG